MKHQQTKFIRVADGAEVGPDQAINGEGMLRNGYSLRTSLQFMDSTQKAVAANDKRRHKTEVTYGKSGEVKTTSESVIDDPDDEVDDAAATLLTDGTHVVDHRPGWRSTNHASDSVEHAEQATREALCEDIHAAHVAAEATRYKGDADLTGGDPALTGTGFKHNFGTPRAGGVCMVSEGIDQGSPGHIDENGVCVADNPRSTDSAADAYAAYDEQATNAWRGGGK